MSETVLPVEPHIPAAELCEKIDLGEEAEALLNDGQTADEFFALLMKHKHYFDAIRMLASVFYKPYAVEWACASVRWGGEGKLKPEAEALVGLAEVWIMDPSEENRRAAMEGAEKNEYSCPAAWTAASAGWTGGSLAPAGLPDVPPADDLTAQASGGAISMVVVENAAQIEKRAAAVLDIGLEIAKKPVPESVEEVSEEAAAEDEAAQAPKATTLQVPTATSQPPVAPMPETRPAPSPPTRSLRKPSGGDSEWAPKPL